MIPLTETDTRPARDDYPRDQYGRVTIGDTILYSPSSLPNYLGAGFSAPAWSARCQAKGAGLAPWLGLRAAPLDITADRAELDQIVAEMETAGGRQAKADQGTAMHSAIRRLWRGLEPDVPDTMVDDIASVREVINEWGMELVDGFDERFVISHELSTGGSCDAYVRAAKLGGDMFACDAKTGQLKPLDCAIQLACYANATHTWDGVGDPEPIPFNIRTDIGLVLHAPWGKASARIVAVDLIEGRRLAELAIAAHRETLDSGRVVIKGEDLDALCDAAADVEAKQATQPSLHARIGSIIGRLQRVIAHTETTKTDVAKLMNDYQLPPLSQPDNHTTDTVDSWDSITMFLELEMDPGDRTDSIIERLKALPEDLYTQAQNAAKQLDPPIPHLKSADVTHYHLDRLEEIIQPIETTAHQRTTTNTESN